MHHSEDSGAQRAYSSYIEIRPKNNLNHTGVLRFEICESRAFPAMRSMRARLTVRITSISLFVQFIHTSRETATLVSSNPGLAKIWRIVCLLPPWLCLSSPAGSTASPYCYGPGAGSPASSIGRVPRPDIVSLARAASLGRHRLPPLCSLTTIARPRDVPLQSISGRTDLATPVPLIPRGTCRRESLMRISGR